MEKQTALNICNTIKQQLYAGGTTKVWSWGAHAWKYGISEDGKNAYLLFRVRGLLYKGLVMVVYESEDTYTVKLVRKDAEGKFNTTREQSDVYCMELTEVVDTMVEYTGDRESYRKALDDAKEPYIDFSK